MVLRHPASHVWNRLSHLPTTAAKPADKAIGVDQILIEIQMKNSNPPIARSDF
jgi:hypothetical protein